MAIYAIADLHLSLAQDKPMSIFGPRWERHEEKIRENWHLTVGNDDTVLICGDHSWALKLEEAVADLNFIGGLPGRKILIKGNHDLWWQSKSKIQKYLPAEMLLLQNNHFEVEGVAICGTRGWVCPNDDNFTQHDVKIYHRELGRLENSLQSATRASREKIIVMLHYPPFNSKREPSGFVEIMERYGVRRCVYGHLHADSQRLAVTGCRNGITYDLVACDYTNFAPVLISDNCS